MSCFLMELSSSLAEVSDSAVSNNRGGVIGGPGDHDGGGMIGGGGLVSGGGVNSLGVLGLTIIGHIGDKAVIAVGAVVDVLDPAVGKGDRVGALSIAGAVRALGGLEVGLGVVIGDGVGEGVGTLLGEVIGDISGLGGGVVGGGVDHRGVVGGGGVNYRGNIGRAAIHWGVRGSGGGDKGGDAGEDLVF